MVENLFKNIVFSYVSGSIFKLDGGILESEW